MERSGGYVADTDIMDAAVSPFPGHLCPLVGVQSRERAVLTGSFLKAAPPGLPLITGLCERVWGLWLWMGGWGSLRAGRQQRENETRRCPDVVPSSSCRNRSCRETSGPKPQGQAVCGRNRHRAVEKVQLPPAGPEQEAPLSGPQASGVSLSLVQGPTCPRRRAGHHGMV